MAEYRKPMPVPSHESRPYWEGLHQHRLLMPHCDNCGHRWFPPSLLCPACNSNEVGWKEVSGRGKIFSFVVFHRVYHPGFAGEVPYVVALVALEEGPRLLSNVIGIAPEAVTCDLPVRVTYEDITESMTLPKFVPAGQP